MRVPVRIRRHVPPAGMLAILLFGILAGAAMAGCTAHGAGTTTQPASGASSAAPDSVMAAGMVMTHQEAQAAWAAKPAFVGAADDETQAAYQYALAAPDVLQYLPCYCGCARMDHRSNLDCFLKPRTTGSPVVFEEHASYCDVCVKTALKAKQMASDGFSLRQIRSAIDGVFGAGGVPGTTTPQPPT